MKQPRSTTWTWVWMRGPNRSAVQFSMSPKLAIGGLILLLCLIASMIIGLVIYQTNMRQLHESNTQLQSQLQQKDKDIAIMQANIDVIHEKSSNLLDQMQEVTKLETQLKQVIQSASTAQNVKSVSTDKTASQPFKSSMTPLNPLLSTQVGGEYTPMHPEVTALSYTPAPTDTLLQLDTIDQTLERWNSDIPALLSQADQVKKRIEATPTLWPTASTLITSPFGGRNDPFNNSEAYHNGLDIGGDRGDDVLASAAGTVIEAGYDSGKGNYIIIRHTDQLTTRYLHLSKIGVIDGQVVKKGDVIGQLGTTGRSTGPHLHFEIRNNGNPIDPLLMLIAP